MTRTKSTYLALITVLLSPMAANADLVYAPGGSDTTEGNANNCIPVTGCLDFDRYQQVYDSSLFSSLSGPVAISSIAFRIDDVRSGGSGSFSDLRANLSTTSASSTALSLTFADNYGADLSTVFDGVLNWSASGGSGINPFEFVIIFDNLFVYDPNAGNLLFEWQNFGSEFFRGVAFDASNFAPMARVYGNGAGDATGFNRNLGFGLVTRFEVRSVPEPGTLALLGLGLVGMGLARRRRKV